MDAAADALKTMSLAPGTCLSRVWQHARLSAQRPGGRCQDSAPLPPGLLWAGGRASLVLFPLEADLKISLIEGPLRVAPYP